MNKQSAVAVLLTLSFGCRVHAQTTAKFDLPKNLPHILHKLQTHLDQSRMSTKFPGAQGGFTWIDSEQHYYSGSVASGMSDIEHNVPLKNSNRLLAEVSEKYSSQPSH